MIWVPEDGLDTSRKERMCPKDDATQLRGGLGFELVNDVASHDTPAGIRCRSQEKLSKLMKEVLTS